MMSQITKKIVVFFILALIFNLSYSATKSNAFPADTVQRFIKKYGKDSLVTILNKRIKSTTEFIKTNASTLTNGIAAMELNLNSKHFKLGIDTINYINANTKNLNYRLYGKRYGDTMQIIQSFDELKNSNQDMYALFLQNMASDAARMGLGTFCEYLSLPAKALDTLYIFRTSLDDYNKIQTFWTFAEFSKNCSESLPDSKTYTTHYFEELYDQYNLKGIMPLTATYTLGLRPKSDDNTKVYHALKFLAYGLYSNNINITAKNHGADLMYLLKLSNANKIWPKNTATQEVDIEAASYMLWSLCEFREKLKALK